MAIAFTTTVTSNDWDTDMSGWRCPALKIPGAEVDSLFVNRERVDKDVYKVVSEHSLIRWIPKEVPERAVVSINLTKDLSTQEQTAKWKNIAIILTFLGPIAVAIITGYFSFIKSDSSNKSGNSNAATGQQATQGTRNPPSVINVENIQNYPDWLVPIATYYDLTSKREQQIDGGLFTVRGVESKFSEATSKFTWVLSTDSIFEISGRAFRVNNQGLIQPLDQRESRNSIEFSVPACEKDDKIIAVLRIKWRIHEYAPEDIRDMFRSQIR